MQVIVNGALGRMGTVLRSLLEREGQPAVLAAGADHRSADGGIFRSLQEISAPADCIIDFSHHAATGELLNFALEHRLPTVIATTGQNGEELAAIRQASQRIPIFLAGNLSLGIALLLQTVQRAVRIFPDADVEIVERHHNRKLDVPSGTALMLAYAVQAVRPDAGILVGRREDGARLPGEIAIHSLRMGNTVATHEVLISTGTQVISLKQEVLDRTLFAEGALAAAEFLLGQPPGLYTMEDLAV